MIVRNKHAIQPLLFIANLSLHNYGILLLLYLLSYSQLTKGGVQATDSHGSPETYGLYRVVALRVVLVSQRFSGVNPSLG